MEVRNCIKNRSSSIPARDVILSADHYAIELLDGTRLNEGNFARYNTPCETFSHLNSKDIYWMYKTGEWNSAYRWWKYNSLCGKLIKQTFKQYENRKSA